MFSDVHDCALEYLYSVLSFDEGDVIDRKQLEDGLKRIGAPPACTVCEEELRPRTPNSRRPTWGAHTSGTVLCEVPVYLSI